MLRRLVLATAVALAAAAVTPAAADDNVWCVKVEERVADTIGQIDIDSPKPLPPYPNRVCVPMPVDPPIDIPPIIG